MNVIIVNEKEAMNLKINKEGYREGLEKRKGRGNRVL